MEKSFINHLVNFFYIEGDGYDQDHKEFMANVFVSMISIGIIAILICTI